MSFFHEEQICSSQFARTADTSGDWRIVSCRFLVAAVLIECSQAARTDGTRVEIVSRHLFVAAVLIVEHYRHLEKLTVVEITSN